MEITTKKETKTMTYDFDSIAGYETEKEELKRLCEIFNNREKYEKKGAKFPKGIIFYGGAGTGKTLFSKVMASVCGLSVFKIDLGDVENESAICRHIKKVFLKAAKRKEPAMIFFDEMDKVLPNEEERYYTDRSKTILTQLLTLIDGMDSAGNIVFVATCNCYDSLPETLTRSGRLDKKIGLGEPTYSSRVAILKMYAQKSSCRFEMSMEDIAKFCSGFSCAALETLINECLLKSSEDGFVSERLIREMFYEIKEEDIPRVRSAVEDSVRACRNMGAFVVAKTLNAGHYVLNLDSDSVCNDFFNGVISEFDCDYYYEHYDDDYDDENPDKMPAPNAYYSKNDLLNTVTVLFGGYAAEEIILHKIYDNVSGYLAVVDELLFKMAKNGMLGLDLYYSENRDRRLSYAETRLDKLNCVFDEITRECYEKAKAIVLKNKALIKNLITRLVEKQILQQEESETLLAKWGGVQV